jgi:sugar phosphate isomerase/epimerase
MRMRIQVHDLGVCSWSLKPSGMADLVNAAQQLGLSHVHLALNKLVFLDDKQKHAELGHLRASGLTFTAGMISFPGEEYSTIPRIRLTGGFVPDESWNIRRQLTLGSAKIAEELGIKILTTHAGFIPPSNHVDYPKLLARVAELAGALKPRNILLALETGQESASELLQFLNDLPAGNVAVNFDPANMIMYGSGDPIEAIATLSRHIQHVHVKDATASDKPGIEWGKETPIGSGEVIFEEFLPALGKINYTGPLLIERETGDDPIADIQSAIEFLQKLPK